MRRRKQIAALQKQLATEQARSAALETELQALKQSAAVGDGGGGGGGGGAATAAAAAGAGGEAARETTSAV